MPAWHFESLDYPVANRRMASFLAEFPLDSAPAEAHRHGSAELVFIIEGELELTVGEENVVLGKVRLFRLQRGA